MRDPDGPLTERRYIAAELAEVGKKVAGIEAELKHYATKEDLANVKVFMFVTLCAMAVSVGLTVWRVLAG